MFTFDLFSLLDKTRSSKGESRDVNKGKKGQIQHQQPPVCPIWTHYTTNRASRFRLPPSQSELRSETQPWRQKMKRNTAAGQSHPTCEVLYLLSGKRTVYQICGDEMCDAPSTVVLNTRRLSVRLFCSNRTHRGRKKALTPC